jgi:hypothetical protein
MILVIIVCLEKGKMGTFFGGYDSHGVGRGSVIMVA